MLASELGGLVEELCPLVKLARRSRGEHGPTLPLAELARRCRGERAPTLSPLALTELVSRCRGGRSPTLSPLGVAELVRRCRGEQTATPSSIPAEAAVVKSSRDPPLLANSRRASAERGEKGEPLPFFLVSSSVLRNMAVVAPLLLLWSKPS